MNSKIIFGLCVVFTVLLSFLSLGVLENDKSFQDNSGDDFLLSTPFFNSFYSTVMVLGQKQKVLGEDSVFKLVRSVITNNKDKITNSNGNITNEGSKPKKKKVEGSKVILINEDGFFPSNLIISPGEEVVWINNRDFLSALLIGVRELSTMRSHLLNSGEQFKWEFSKPGKYVYVDGVVIGLTGKVIVR